MSEIKKWKELNVTTPSAPGTAAKVFTAIAEANINIWSVCVYDQDENGIWMIVAEDWTKTKGVLIKNGWKVEEKDVLIIEADDKVGSAAAITTKLGAAGININYTYGSGTGAEAVLVFNTSDNDKAFEILNKE